ncbi:MAG: hypothetical protein ACXVB9_12030 [Bdellovibrionota bacterium]
MATRKYGDMGKFALITCALLLATPAFAKPKLARVLPSQVKTVSLQSTKKAHKKKAGAKKAAPNMKLAEFSPELQAEASEYPFASKYYSRTVYFFRSDAVLPDSYNCDAEIEESKKQEAVNQAEGKCESSGGSEQCRVAKVVIAKTGVLQCRDFPGGKCPGSGHFRGCVAEALVLGEKAEPLALSGSSF